MTSQINSLLSTDVYYDLIFGERFRVGPDLPRLRKTYLGWITAVVCKNAEIQKQNVSLVAQTTHADKLIHKFWFIDGIPKKSILTSKDELIN